MLYDPDPAFLKEVTNGTIPTYLEVEANGHV
jgi:hypothetical protein